jgi:hypothetical protein
MTALIIRKQQIYCNKCKGCYNIFIKQENFCSNKIFQLLAKYFVLFLLLVIATCAFLILDAYIKTQYAQENPEEAKELNEYLIDKYSAYPILGRPPDYTKEFSLKESVRWTYLYYLLSIEFILIFRCI